MKKYLSYKKILDILIQFFILEILFLTPLFFSFVVKTINFYEINKFILFKISVIFLLFFSFIRFFFYGNPESINLFWDKVKKYRMAIIIFVIYFTSLFVSTVFSRFYSISIWGSYDRLFGLESIVFFFLFFCLTFLNLKDKRSINRGLIALIFSSFFVSTYAIAQAFGLDPFRWIESTELRVTSTFGQPNFLGAFLLLVIPLNIYLFRETKQYFRYFYLLVLFLNILSLGYTYSIASWLGFLFGLFLLGLYFIYNSKLKFLNKKNLTIASIIVVILFLFISASSVFKTKISSVFNFENGSTAARVDFWKAGIDGIGEKPFFGHGLDSQGEIIPKYYETNWAVHSSIGVRPSRAHNIFLDTLLTTGIFGLISYILLLYLFFSLIIENIKKYREKFLNISLGIAFASYFVYLLFNFSFITSEIIFWFYFAIILWINFQEDENEDKGQNIKNEKNVLFKTLLKLMIVFLLIFFLFGQLRIEINKIIADQYYLEIRQARVNEEYFKALLLFDYIKELEPKTNTYDIGFGEMLAEWTPKVEKYGLVYSFKGTEYLKEIIKNIDRDKYEERLARANIYSYLSNGDEEYFAKAIKEYENLILDYPGIPRNYYKLANIYFKNNKLEKAEKLSNIHFSKIPDRNNENINRDHLQQVEGEILLNKILLGEINGKRGDIGIAVRYFEEANQIIELPGVYNKMANLYQEKGDFEEAIWYNKKAVEIGDGGHLWSYYLAKSYFEASDFENALFEVNKSLDIFPDYQEAINLKKDIENKWGK
jgi:O-antigen ligase/tetratricopeptide (TPR) repeat protein